MPPQTEQPSHLKSRRVVPYIDSFGYDLPSKARAPAYTKTKEDRVETLSLRLPRDAIVREAPLGFRESIPSAISPNAFEATDLEDLHILAEKIQPRKSAGEVLQKQKQLEELQQRLADQEEEAKARLEEATARLDACLAQKLVLENQLEQARSSGRLLEERQRQFEDLLGAEREQSKKLAAEKHEMEQLRQTQREELLQQKEQEIQAVLREERLQSQELLAKQAARQSDSDKRKQAELEAVRARLCEVTQKLEQELRSRREAKELAAKARLEGELRTLKAREEELQQALRQREAEALNAGRRAAAAEARLAEKELEASEAISRAQQSAEEARTSRAKVAELAEERSQLQAELDDLHAGAQQMQADSHEHRQQLQASRHKLDSSSAEVRRLQQEKEDLQSRLEMTQSKVCALELGQRQHEDCKQHLQEQLRSQGQELTDSQTTSRQMSAQLKELQRCCEELVQDSEAKRRDLEASQTLLQEALETKGQLQEALEAAQERAFGLQEEVSLVQSRDIEEARAALQGALEDRSELQAKLEAAHEKALGLQEQVHAHDELYKELEETQRALSEALAARDAAAAREAASKLRVEESQEAELTDAMAQKELLEAQLAATIARLDEEQAERIRQGARAETLEKDLASQQRIYSEQTSATRGKIVERSWLQLAVAAALHAQEITSRQMMSELVASRREALSSAQERQQLAESVRAEVDDQKQALETQTQRSQDEDMATCLKENEELRARNRELTLSMQHFKEENDQLHVDNCSLLESVALFEADLGKVSDRHAELIGHVNKKQKIRYTVKLKEECAQLRQDLNKARHKLMQLEGSRRSDSLYGALASLGYSPPPAIEMSPQPKPRSHTHSPNSPASQAQGPQLRPGGRLPLEEAQRRLRLQECALERVNSDFQHLVALVQRVIGRSQGEEAQETSFAELLQDLRRVMAAQGAQSAADTSHAKNEPSTPRARESLASPLSLRQTSQPLDSEPKVEPQDKENQLNMQNQTPVEDVRPIAPETHEVVRKVLKQINFALSFGSRKLYGRPIGDARSFFEALDRHGNGVLERKDIAQGFKRLDIVLPRNTLEMLVKMVDQDANGLMSVEELLKALERSERVTAKTNESLSLSQAPRWRQ